MRGADFTDSKREDPLTPCGKSPVRRTDTPVGSRRYRMALSRLS